MATKNRELATRSRTNSVDGVEGRDRALAALSSRIGHETRWDEAGAAFSIGGTHERVEGAFGALWASDEVGNRRGRSDS